MLNGPCIMRTQKLMKNTDELEVWILFEHDIDKADAMVA